MSSSDFESVPGGQLLSPADPNWDPLGPQRRAFQEFAKLTREKRGLEGRVKEIEGRLDALAAQIRTFLEGELLLSEGVVVDGFRIYLRRQLWAKRHEWVSSGEIIAVLKESGLGHMVREEYSASTLSSHIHELEEQHREELDSGAVESVAQLLPPALAGLVDVKPSYTVVALAKTKK
jgi:hypothetical protein